MDETPWHDKYKDDENFGLFLAAEHLKTTYPLFLIAAIDKIGDELQATVFSSTDNKAIDPILAQKLIEHLQKYV